MISRFQGEAGKRRLIQALCDQIIVRNQEDIAKAIIEKGQLIEIQSTSDERVIVKQNDETNDVFLIVTGKVAVYINERLVVERLSGSHVGEMALIDPTKRRSATNIVTENAVLIKISEEDFTELAETYPVLWRRLAIELANRLRDRSVYFNQPNPIPKVFIGSSREQLPVAEEIQLKLQHANLIATTWTDNVFEATQNSIDSLLKEVQESDFAVIIFGRDDTVVSRNTEYTAPRDNVVFEFGLFMGAIGKNRTIFVKPSGSSVKIPSDLYGITCLEYSDGDSTRLTTNIAPVCTKIKQIVSNLGAK